ncbi:hypothetical protein [Nonomuraea sp. KM90]
MELAQARLRLSQTLAETPYALIDRLAGCLVLQYAQHVTRIARLTT